jgi:hypothetical protein
MLNAVPPLEKDTGFSSFNLLNHLTLTFEIVGLITF